MTKLIIVRGVSGSGKSTFAREYKRRNPHTIIVNRDKIREVLFGSEEDYGVDEDLVTTIQETTIRGAFEGGWDVVVDNTNVIWYWVEDLARIASAYKAEVEIIDVNVGLEQAKLRNASRAANGGRFVPEHVIDKQWAHYLESK